MIVLRICESIDNSKMILFGYKCSSKILKNIFDRQAVQISIKNLLEREGIIYFGHLGVKYWRPSRINESIFHIADVITIKEAILWQAPAEIAGPGIKKGMKITEPNNTVNTAAMILYLFKIKKTT